MDIDINSMIVAEQAQEHQVAKNFDDVLARVQKALPARYGFDSRDERNFTIITRYLAHMICNTADRGLILGGKTGTGKTLAMQLILAQTSKRRERAGFVGAQEYSSLVSTKGQSGALAAYTSELVVPDRAKVGTGVRRLENAFKFADLIIDDIGSESDAKHYGVAAEPVVELIAARYDMWKRCGARTFATTNNTQEELRNMYGDRFASRIAEMCHYASFGGADRRMGLS